MKTKTRIKKNDLKHKLPHLES